MKRWLLVFLLGLLPVAALTAQVASLTIADNKASTVDIAIRGFDPRDVLRGHYIQFQYNFGERERSEKQEYIYRKCGGEMPDCCLCLTENKETPLRPFAEVVACNSNPEGPKACMMTLDPGNAMRSVSDERNPVLSGMFFIPEAGADDMQRELLNNPQLFAVRLAVRADGTFRPVALLFNGKVWDKASGISIK